MNERTTRAAGESRSVYLARRASAAIVLVASGVTLAFGQDDPDDLARRLLATSGVRAAVDAAIELEAKMVADEIALCEILAPPFAEQARAEAFRARLAALGLERVRVDALGNALGRGGVKTVGPITFMGTVSEEGLGDLRGVKHLFGTELVGSVDRFVSVDGAGLGITNVTVGSTRYRTRF